MKPSRSSKPLALAAAMVFTLLVSRQGHAYAWMISHGYTGCSPCHTDPSGGTALSAYGRAQGDLLLRSQYPRKRHCPSGGEGSAEGDGEAAPSAGFLWGLVDLPDALRLGGDLRGAWMTAKPGPAALAQRYILMRSDVFADVKIAHFRAAASLGYAHTGALAAALTRAPEDNLISREHWLGFELDDDASWLLRAGRMALPYGIRNVEHNLWVRSATRTDLLDNQQYGAALAVSKANVRAEIMAIAGNYQLRPDDYRERGYSGYVEWAPSTRFALGVSSLITRARRDVTYRVTDYRHAHGLFMRYAPRPGLVVLAEADGTYHSLTENGHRLGGAGMLQVDWEPRQGLHLMLTGETKTDGNEGDPLSYGGWFSAVWFFGAHADLRLDEIYQRFARASGSIDALALLAQLHLYL